MRKGDTNDSHYNAHCTNCGHVWRTRVPNPVECNKCKKMGFIVKNDAGLTPPVKKLPNSPASIDLSPDNSQSADKGSAPLIQPSADHRTQHTQIDLKELDNKKKKLKVKF